MPPYTSSFEEDVLLRLTQIERNLFLLMKQGVQIMADLSALEQEVAEMQLSSHPRWRF
jgi:hypothetical protein